ncbi:MAG: AAA family ATPase [Deltaproteobacteria bacterium]|nr:AAA family ATPase [Deltaproteobacteria bacterium]
MFSFAGKGGVGKTTLSGLLIKIMLENGMKPILAVDADANANLNEVLGLPVCGTLGDAREQMKTDVGTGMTKDIYIDMKVNASLVEAEGYDLSVMGRPEGSGCYCAANTLLTCSIEKLIKNYDFLVVDNEAGMEHLSRLITKHVDLMIVVTDSSKRGIAAARRINELVKELKITYGKMVTVANRVIPGQEDFVMGLIREEGMDCAGVIHQDELISEFDGNGKPTFTLPKESLALADAYKVFEPLLRDYRR